MDVSNPNEPKVCRLQIQENTNNLTIVPASISDALDLSGHAFDYAVAFRWGDYELICVQRYVNGTTVAPDLSRLGRFLGQSRPGF